MYYQIVNRFGVPFGSPIASGTQLLRNIPERIRPIMLKLGMRVTLIERPGSPPIC
jgi:hypothetical protein